MEDKIELLSKIDNEKDFYLYIIILMNLGVKISDIRNYLERNNIKYSPLKILFMSRKYNEKTMNLIFNNMHSELFDNYNNILNAYTRLASFVGLTKPMELCLFFDYLLYNGYLSYNEKFEYNDLYRFYGGYSISSGTGVCSNMSMMLMDFLKKSGVQVELFINYIKTKDSNVVIRTIENHAAVYVKDKDNFVFDITNRSIVYKCDKNRYASINEKYNYICRNNNKEDFSVTTNKYNLINECAECCEKVNEIIDDNEELIKKVYLSVQEDMQQMNDLLKKERVRK